MVIGVAQVQGLRRAEVRRARAARSASLLAARRIGIDEVSSALQAANVNLPTGTLWGRKQAFTVQANGQLMNADGVPPMIVAYRNGSPVRLRRAGDVDRRREDDKVGVLVLHRPRSRALHHAWRSSASPAPTPSKSSTAIKALLPQFRAKMPPSVKLDILYDRSETIRESVNDVKFTMLADLVLVVAGDFPVPAQRLGHRHSQPGAAVLDHRHVRRDVPARLQRSTTCR